MTNVILCTGAQARHPYHWLKFGVSVHSIEELCFYIVRNRYLIGMDAFDQEMIDWIGEECALETLAERLRILKRTGRGVVDFAMAILEYVNYNTPEEIEETRQTLLNSSDMDIYEKHLARAAYLMQNRRYTQAFEAYESLRAAVPADDKELHAEILHNEGVMHARLFSFMDAAECFSASYELVNSPETYLSFLASLRMQMTEQEYVDYITGDARGYQFSMTLESLMSAASEDYLNSGEHMLIERVFSSKVSGSRRDYYALIEKMCDDFKKEYRMIAEDSLRLKDNGITESSV